MNWVLDSMLFTVPHSVKTETMALICVLHS